MRTIDLNIANYHVPGDVIPLFHKHDLQFGDTIKVTTQEGNEDLTLLIVVVIAVALVIFYQQKKKRKDNGESILNNLFKQIVTIEEIEKEVEQEYGIKIVVETKPNEERGFWNRMTAIGLSKAHSSEEPDYSDVIVKEPNPSYKP